MSRIITLLTLSMLVVLAGGSRGPLCAQRVDPYEPYRREMVDEHIAHEGVTNERVLEVMRTVPRHMFVRPELRRHAYFDQALDIGHKQTISPPFIVAYMTEVLDPQPTDKVLEIGTGSGYQAAVLSGLVADVYTIEIVEPLGEAAARLLERLGYSNVHPRIGDGYLGWPEHAPFDKIIVTCSPEKVPQPLIDQLQEGGKLIIPLGERYQQVFHLFEKQDGQLVETKLLPTLFVPMTGKSEQEREVQPDPRNPQVVNGGFELSTLEEGKADGWHYQRQCELVSSGAPQGARFMRFENDEPGRNAHMLQGLALDGRVIESLTVTLTVQLTELGPGTESFEQPGLLMHFFDIRRKPVGVQHLPFWTSELPAWTPINGQIAVPRGTKEVIVQVGLNGATGVLSLDDLKIQAAPRN
ncbi:MAG: protein-L-isoaspartate(D-aspartate) O-methyltransferase [Planctomycetaceae bacterium]|nr:protein-L-isoaspartate(D-aspartate) O-methyltransferase [Planctomycetaceae bacterium]